ncbi:sulfotransferase [Algirhabdus cladophorae]|uniref:sulfotransferase n=1 Tax=Algirhabdus cladophorae TaxID=3377108 RepID=UPI003B84524F
MAQPQIQKTAFQQAFQQKQFLASLELSAHFVKQHGDDVEAMQCLAQSCYNIGKFDEAFEVYVHAFDLFGHAELLSGAAAAKSASGDLKLAKDLAQAAIKLSPYNVGAWRTLAQVHRFAPKDMWLLKAQRLAQKSDAPPVFKRAIHYVLCKAMNDLGKWQRAWKAAQKAATFDPPRYDPVQLTRYVTALSGLDPERLRKMRRPAGSEISPIFIVGMPRSGTSLLEAQLHKHFDLGTFGEVHVFASILSASLNEIGAGRLDDGLPKWFEDWSPTEIDAAARRYQTELMARDQNAFSRPCVDKMPGNILCLPMISILFPKARVIRMRRDARDTCVSCYLGEFSGGNNFTYQLDWLARAYHDYQSAGDTGAQFLETPPIDVHYEDLVSSPDQTLDALGTTLKLNKRAQPVETYKCSTRSATQVRAPISAKSIGRWRNYTGHVDPLITALEKFGP